MSYYATSGQLEQVKYAMEIGGKLLDHFEKYFNILYPLPKAGLSLYLIIQSVSTNFSRLSFEAYLKFDK